MRAGLIFITTRFSIKKFLHLSMAVMAKKKVAKMPSILLLHFPATWRQMDYYSMKAICFLKNINMVLSLHSMAHGIVHQSHRKVSLLHLFLLKMESQTEIGKYLPIISLAAIKSCLQIQQSIDPAV